MTGALQFFVASVGGDYDAPLPGASTPSDFELLVHFDTYDGTGDPVDERSHDVVLQGAVDRNTSIKKFGTASGQMVGSSVTVQGLTNIGRRDFTAGCWFYWDGSNSGAGEDINLLLLHPINWLFRIDYSAGNTLVFSDGSTDIGSTGVPLPQNTWHFLCIDRVAGKVSASLNGDVFAYFTNKGTIGSTTMHVGASGVGGGLVTALGYGYVDEMMLQIGASYFGGGDFTVPASAFSTPIGAAPSPPPDLGDVSSLRTPATRALALTRYAPVVVLSGGNHTVLPFTGSINFAGYQPNYVPPSGVTVVPAAGAFAVTRYAPTVAVTNIVAGGPYNLTPAVREVDLIGRQPSITVSASGSVTRTPGVGAIAATGIAPTIAVSASSGNVARTPGAGAIAITGSVPSADVGSSTNYTKATAQNLSVPYSGSGTISSGTDPNWYKFTTASPADLTVSLVGSSFDTYLVFFNSLGKVVAYDDDSGGGGTSQLTYVNAAADTYYFALSGWSAGTTHGPSFNYQPASDQATGSYSLAVTTAAATPAPSPATPSATTAGTAVALLHMEGTNGGSTFTESISGLTVTKGGTVTTSNEQAKFGSTSARFDRVTSGTPNSLSIPLTTIVGDFTIAAWAWYEFTSAGNTGSGSDNAVFGIDAFDIHVYIPDSGKPTVYSLSSGTDVITSTNILTPNVWHLFALERKSGVFYLSVDGVIQGSGWSLSNNLSATSLSIGATVGGNKPFGGFIDDVFVQYGQAYFGGGSNFNPPTSAFGTVTINRAPGAGSATFAGSAPTVAVSAPALGLDSYTTDLWIAFGLKRLLTSYSGPIMTVRRASDNTTMDIGFSGNSLDSSALETFAAGGDAFIKTWYDQTGNGRDLRQNTNTSQPQICFGGSYIDEMVFDGVDDFFILQASDTTFLATPSSISGMTWFAKMENYNPTGTQVLIEHSTNPMAGSNTAANVMFDGTNFVTTLAGTVSPGVYGNEVRSYGTSMSLNRYAWRFDLTQSSAATQTSVFVAGSGQTTSGTGNVITSTAFTSTYLFMGMRNFGSYPAYLGVQGFVMYKAAVNDTDLAAISAQT